MPEHDDVSSAAPDQPRRRNALSRSLTFTLMFLLLAYVFLGGRNGSLWKDTSPVTRDFEVMNTYARIIIPKGGSTGLTPGELADLAEGAVREIDRLMSPFGEHSDIRRLNETPADVWVEVNPLTWTVVMEALRWHRLSGGAFDPTIGPVKRLFVFDRTEADALPDEAQLAFARQRIGGEKLRFEREGMRLSWATDGMRLDLGAIAKGFSADHAAGILLANGVDAALVDVGGELRVIGEKPGPPPAPWTLGIRNPRDPNNTLETIPLTSRNIPTGTFVNAGVATSGDYERFFIFQGKRYEHIIDPRSGMPLTDGPASVTVFYPGSCLAADALATTLCVMGPDEGRAFLKSQTLGLFSKGVRIIMLLPQGDDTFRRLEFRIAEKGDFHETEAIVGKKPAAPYFNNDKEDAK